MKRKTKTFAVMMVMLLICSLVMSACSSESGNKSEAGGNSGDKQTSDNTGSSELFTPVGTYPIVSKQMKLKMFAPQFASIENMDTNEFTKYVEEKTNIDIQWELVPDNALNDRKQLMLASGDYPEVILQGALTKEEQMKYGKQGVFIPLNDLIDKYAPNFKKALTDIPYLKSSITAPDGNIYALPQINECYHCDYAMKLWINKEWLDKLGLSVPTTTDEFYTVLKAFKEKDPNGNGKKDEIPLTGSDEMWAGNVSAFLMNAFIMDDYTEKSNGTFLSVKDGKVDMVADKEEWKQGLLYLNKLYKEGLIDPAAFTQNADAIQQLANREPDNVMGGLTTALISYAHSPDDKHPRHKEYVTVPPLKGPNGVQQTIYFAGIGSSQFAITNKATEEQQIAAIRLADYLYTEEAIVLEEHGPEGKGWRKATDGEMDMDGKQAKYTAIIPEVKKTTHNDGWEQIGPSLRTYAYRNSWTTPQDPLADDGYGTRLQRESEKYEPFKSNESYPNSVFIALEDAEAAAQLQTTIRDYIKSNMAQFITGSKDIGKEWDSYVKGFAGLQVDKYMEIYQNALAVK
ncbi:ABC transporter substrate-binding protein [Paenibacillus nasutitermitis]|uniref:Sugar ABC transporter substrate-binding protein n=1 Tax=Paenibacillus nasutitermitis TaxID=1652958 RepID=A0A916ZI45_9BACL|nr:ABC transporter substrate-binding protein [Paenibacillus nasutitermitis]GGD97547.1 sugar ABC transporter substrate-binding protein [Paenibacillus nasutitermitis]